LSLDIAVYGAGPARPTGGGGSVALLIGPNAPLHVSSIKQNFFKHSFDFYKPDLTSEYPYVDGPLSIKQYYEALDKCYQGWRIKAKNCSEIQNTHQVLENLDYICFHCPFSKLVQKSFGRLLYNDLITCPDNLLKIIGKENFDSIEKFKNYSKQQSLQDKELERAFVQVSKSLFASKCDASLLIARNVGNMYTPSLYGGLISLISTGKLTGGESIGMFSYGSGVAATFYKINVKQNEQLNNINNCLADLQHRLNQRKQITPAEMELYCSQREMSNKLSADELDSDWTPRGPISDLESGITFLNKIDSKWRRHYQLNSDLNQNYSSMNH
jgi:hydroxymethylglutaryl-CoA synthase